VPTRTNPDTDLRTIPGVGWLSYCKDTEGNTFCIMQEDTSVK